VRSNLKKSLALFLLLVICCFGGLIPVYADAGPKPSITIKAKNMPDAICYIDLLVYDSSSNVSERIKDKYGEPRYNQLLINKLIDF